jgi:hypothetical protein
MKYQSELPATFLSALDDTDNVRKYSEPPAKFLSALKDTDTVEENTVNLQQNFCQHRRTMTLFWKYINV